MQSHLDSEAMTQCELRKPWKLKRKEVKNAQGLWESKKARDGKL